MGGGSVSGIVTLYAFCSYLNTSTEEYFDVISNISVNSNDKAHSTNTTSVTYIRATEPRLNPTEFINFGIEWLVNYGQKSYFLVKGEEDMTLEI